MDHPNQHMRRTAYSRRSFLRNGGLALGGAVILGNLNACGDDDDATSNAAGSSGSSSTTAPAGGSPSTGGEVTGAFFGSQAQIDAWYEGWQPSLEEMYPGLTANMIGYNATSWDQFGAKLTTDLAAGNGPDITNILPTLLGQLVTNDLLEPLDDYINRDKEELRELFADVPGFFFETFMYDGSVYGMPTSYNAGILAYSTALMEESGLSRPADDWTKDDFYDYVSTFAGDRNVAGYAYPMFGMTLDFITLAGGTILDLSQFSGGDWLWDEFYADDPNRALRAGGFNWGAPTANSAEVIEGVQFLVDLHNEGISPTPAMGNGPALAGDFAGSRIFMTPSNAIGAYTMSGMAPDDFDVVYLPQWRNQRQGGGGTGWVMLKSAPDKDAAWEMMKYLTSVEASRVATADLIDQPTRRSLFTDERFTDSGPEHWELVRDAETEFGDPMPVHSPPYSFAAGSDAFAQRIIQAFDSGDVKKAMDDLQQDLETLAEQG